jgi:hypothetical protein
MVGVLLGFLVFLGILSFISIVVSIQYGFYNINWNEIIIPTVLFLILGIWMLISYYQTKKVNGVIKEKIHTIEQDGVKYQQFVYDGKVLPITKAIEYNNNRQQTPYYDPEIYYVEIQDMDQGWHFGIYWDNVFLPDRMTVKKWDDYSNNIEKESK